MKKHQSQHWKNKFLILWAFQDFDLDFCSQSYCWKPEKNIKSYLDGFISLFLDMHMNYNMYGYKSK